MSKKIDFKLVEKNWDTIKENLKNKALISNVSFNTWIKPLEIADIVDSTIYIYHPDENFIDLIESRYLNMLRFEIDEYLINIDYSLKMTSNNKIKKKKVSSPSSLSFIDQNLNNKYTFDTFVVGSNNKFAHAASLAVAENPSEVYNPLFLYGGVGLGKTHLMQSIAHFIYKNRSDAKVLYVTSESFTNELIDAIRNKNAETINKFREKYRNIDVLLIDDIQFIIGKESTQEEFFHTFNFLYNAKKQIVISSDKPPRAFDTLEERLRSRFEMGLTADISSPDYETRMAILRKKEEMEGYNIDNEVLKYIATNVCSNIREIEGALTTINAYSKLYRTNITVEVAQKALKNIIATNEKKEITVDLIINIVAEHFNFKDEDLISTKKHKEIAYPRQIAMYLCRELTEASLKAIGEALGGRDHTTIMHGHSKIEEDLKKNESTISNIAIIKKKLGV